MNANKSLQSISAAQLLEMMNNEEIHNSLKEYFKKNSYQFASLRESILSEINFWSPIEYNINVYAGIIANNNRRQKYKTKGYIDSFKTLVYDSIDNMLQYKYKQRAC